MNMNDEDAEFRRQRQAEFDAEMAVLAQRKLDALKVLGPLGFVDSEDGEYPNDIYHPVIGTFDCTKITLANVVNAAFNAGREDGAKELRTKFRELLRVDPAGSN